MSDVVSDRVSDDSSPLSVEPSCPAHTGEVRDERSAGTEVLWPRDGGVRAAVGEKVFGGRTEEGAGRWKLALMLTAAQRAEGAGHRPAI